MLAGHRPCTQVSQSSSFPQPGTSASQYFFSSLPFFGRELMQNSSSDPAPASCKIDICTLCLNGAYPVCPSKAPRCRTTIQVPLASHDVMLQSRALNPTSEPPPSSSSPSNWPPIPFTPVPPKAKTSPHKGAHTPAAQPQPTAAALARGCVRCRVPPHGRALAHTRLAPMGCWGWVRAVVR